MHKKTTVPEPFFIKKKDSGTGFFLRIFANFLRTDFFYRALLVAASQSYNLTQCIVRIEGHVPLLFTFKEKLSGVPVKCRITFLVFFGCYTIKNNEIKRGVQDFFLVHFSSYCFILYLNKCSVSLYFEPKSQTHFFFQCLFTVLHAKLQREWIRSTKIGARERSVAKLYFFF